MHYLITRGKGGITVHESKGYETREECERLMKQAKSMDTRCNMLFGYEIVSDNVTGEAVQSADYQNVTREDDVVRDTNRGITPIRDMWGIGLWV